MSPYLIERLAELRRHLDHLRALRPRVTGREVSIDPGVLESPWNLQDGLDLEGHAPRPPGIVPLSHPVGEGSGGGQG